MKVLTILFLLAMTGCVYSESCPSVEEIDPCTCSELIDGRIYLRCDEDDDEGENSLTLADVKQALNAVREKKRVEIGLYNMNLGTVPSNFFHGIDIITIDIINCDLQSLTDDEKKPVLAGLEDSLKDLTIEESFTQKVNPVKKLNLEHLRKLTFLRLAYNYFPELSNDWFANGPASLEELVLTKNGVETVGDSVFVKLTNLKQLIFHGNRQGYVKRSMFPSSADRLYLLNLMDNGLSSLPDDIFSDMPNLKVIWLDYNNFARLEAKPWKEIWNDLEQVDFSDNPMECDSHMSWTFDMLGPDTIVGTCKGGREISDFIKHRGQ